MADGVADLGLRHRHMARAADDGACEPLAMACDVGARDEAAERVPEEEVGEVCAHARLHEVAQRVHVGDEHVDAGALGQAAVTAGLGARTVPDLVVAADGEAAAGEEARERVVVAADGEAAAGEEARERVVALDVLGHAVGELDGGARRALGQPDPALDLARVVGARERDGFTDDICHGNPFALMRGARAPLKYPSCAGRSTRLRRRFAQTVARACRHGATASMGY